MRWILYFIPAILIELFCWLTTPIAALFVVKRLRIDRVKRLNNETLTFDREYLWGWVNLWNTHDNAVDEYFWGMFNTDSVIPFIRNATRFDYDNSRWIRYACRCLWMWRNPAYGFHYALFSRPVDAPVNVKVGGDKGKGLWWKLSSRPSSFQLQAQIPTWPGAYQDINIGWKAHDGFSRLMYANRIIGFRKY